MSENDSQRPQDVGNAGETQQQPRVQVESTPAGSNIPYVQAYDTQTGQPLGGAQVVNKHTVVKTKTKKLPIFITALAGCACGALLVIALIMSGTLDIGGGKNAVTAGASGSSTQKITIDSEDTTLAEAVSAKALPSVVSITATSSGGPEWLAFAVCRRVEQLGQRRFGRGARYRGPYPHQQPRGRWL